MKDPLAVVDRLMASWRVEIDEWNVEFVNMQVNSENYALAAHHFKPARAARIAQAVERSKSEYQPEHAYTERGVSLGLCCL